MACVFAGTPSEINFLAQELKWFRYRHIVCSKSNLLPSKRRDQWNPCTGCIFGNALRITRRHGFRSKTLVAYAKVNRNVGEGMSRSGSCPQCNTFAKLYEFYRAPTSEASWREQLAITRWQPNLLFMPTHKLIIQNTDQSTSWFSIFRDLFDGKKPWWAKMISCFVCPLSQKGICGITRRNRQGKWTTLKTSTGPVHCTPPIRWRIFRGTTQKDDKKSVDLQGDSMIRRNARRVSHAPLHKGGSKNPRGWSVYVACWCDLTCSIPAQGITWWYP